MYYLDFVTIVRLLKEFRRSGMLQTELPKGTIVNMQEGCLLQLKLLKGEIVDYRIVTKRGETILVDQDMLSQIEELGPREWTFGALRDASLANILDTDHLTAPRLKVIVPSPAYERSLSLQTLVPHRLVLVKYHSSSRLTRQQRRVLALVDGKRNVGQIAVLLFSLSTIESGVQEVLTTLQELEEFKIIVLQ